MTSQPLKRYPLFGSAVNVICDPAGQPMLVVLIELPEPLELLELLEPPLTEETVTRPPFTTVTVSKYDPIDGGCGCGVDGDGVGVGGIGVGAERAVIVMEKSFV